MLKEATTQAKEQSRILHETTTDLNRERVAEITAALHRTLPIDFRFRTISQELFNAR